MHIVETYALSSGSKINKPFVYTKYVPLPFQNFISFQAAGKAQPREYDYWQEVIDFIKPTLDHHGIAIVQVGSKEEKPFVGTLPLNGQTDLGQLAYVISRAKLHLGVDSCGVHLASAFDIPIVSIFGNSHPKNCGPFFGDKEKQVCLTPFNKDLRPSYASFEEKKSINKLKPEEIAREVLDLLSLKSESKIYKTLSRGPKYPHSNIQCVPDSVSNFGRENISNVIMRMDLLFDQDILANQLSKSKCSIITKEPIITDILSQFQSSITQIVYLLDENHDPSFVEKIKFNGINFALLSEMSDEKIQAIKMDYMEYGLIQKKKTTAPEDIEVIRKHGCENLFYRSKKFFISKGKIFPSIAAWEEGKPIDGAKAQTLPVIDKKSFWSELEDYYILKNSN
jgi:hypothetical protein